MSDIDARFDQINTPEHIKPLVEEAREFMKVALGETAIYLGYLQRASESSALWEYSSDERHSLLGINFVGNALIVALYQRLHDQQSQPTHASLVVDYGQSRLFTRTSSSGPGPETEDIDEVSRFRDQVLELTHRIREESGALTEPVEPEFSRESQSLQAA